MNEFKQLALQSELDCLQDKPEPQVVAAPQDRKCGNRIVEAPEECDCGSEEVSQTVLAHPDTWFVGHIFSCRVIGTGKGRTSFRKMMGHCIN